MINSIMIMITNQLRLSSLQQIWQNDIQELLIFLIRDYANSAQPLCYQCLTFSIAIWNLVSIFPSHNVMSWLSKPVLSGYLADICQTNTFLFVYYTTKFEHSKDHLPMLLLFECLYLKTRSSFRSRLCLLPNAIRVKKAVVMVCLLPAFSQECVLYTRRITCGFKICW